MRHATLTSCYMYVKFSPIRIDLIDTALKRALGLVTRLPGVVFPFGEREPFR
jgi:hypothetical protein